MSEYRAVRLYLPSPSPVCHQEPVTQTYALCGFMNRSQYHHTGAVIFYGRLMITVNERLVVAPRALVPARAPRALPGRLPRAIAWSQGDGRLFCHSRWLHLCSRLFCRRSNYCSIHVVFLSVMKFVSARFQPLISLVLIKIARLHPISACCDL